MYVSICVRNLSLCIFHQSNAGRIENVFSAVCKMLILWCKRKVKDYCCTNT